MKYMIVYDKFSLDVLTGTFDWARSGLTGTFDWARSINLTEPVIVSFLPATHWWIHQQH